ncbi:Probable cytochrome P450 313a1 [Eumeta japonica]|uniref:Probable cytochrome P450 313a1 n=1 Tax=Eumeta variegata TaxID=151549 RepID=A0A4C1V2X9_EUMVA|nr:Probable cytochrome P450 313a1 [Eumeta japonica]
MAYGLVSPITNGGLQPSPGHQSSWLEAVPRCGLQFAVDTRESFFLGGYRIYERCALRDMRSAPSPRPKKPVHTSSETRMQVPAVNRGASTRQRVVYDRTRGFRELESNAESELKSQEGTTSSSFLTEHWIDIKYKRIYSMSTRTETRATDSVGAIVALGREIVHMRIYKRVSGTAEPQHTQGRSGGAKGYSNIELREESFILIAAGTDTSAVALGFTLTLLAKYPDVQERVYRELHEVFGKSDRQLEKEDLLKLTYTERVIKESLRLFPPVPIIVRKIEEEITLPSGQILPAGAGAVVSLWGAHRDPAHWGPDADHFDPDRFLPEWFRPQHTCSYIPFSNGPRNCLGFQYAIMSLKTGLATVLRRCRVVSEPERGPVPHIDVKFEVMMKSVNDFQLRFVKRY